MNKKLILFGAMVAMAFAAKAQTQNGPSGDKKPQGSSPIPAQPVVVNTPVQAPKPAPAENPELKKQKRNPATAPTPGVTVPLPVKKD